jgi:hypothetical protein
MNYAKDDDKLPVQELGRKLRDLSVNIVAEPTPEDMVVILDKLERQVDDDKSEPPANKR